MIEDEEFEDDDDDYSVEDEDEEGGEFNDEEYDEEDDEEYDEEDDEEGQGQSNQAILKDFYEVRVVHTFLPYYIIPAQGTPILTPRTSSWTTKTTKMKTKLHCPLATRRKSTSPLRK